MAACGYIHPGTSPGPHLHVSGVAQGVPLCPMTVPEAPLRIPMSCLSPTRPITWNSVTGTREVINALVFHVQQLQTDFVNDAVSSSWVSSVPDGAWREPSPPPNYDPNFDWNESD